jgi:hypothetical protein
MEFLQQLDYTRPLVFGTIWVVAATLVPAVLGAVIAAAAGGRASGPGPPSRP